MSNGAPKRMPVDLRALGQTWGWKQALPGNIPAVEEVLERGEPIAIIQDAGRKSWFGTAGLIPSGPSINSEWPLDLSSYRALIVISDRKLPQLPPELGRHTLVYRPPTLALGVSCFRHLEMGHLAESVKLFFERAGLAEECLTALAAPASRRNEASLIEFAEERAVPLLTYAADKLAIVPRKWPHARRMAGLCELSAKLAAGVLELAAPKQVFQRLALAVARRTWA